MQLCVATYAAIKEINICALQKMEYELTSDQLPIGSIAQLVEQVQCNRMVMGWNPVHWAWIYFRHLFTSDQLPDVLIAQLVEQKQCDRRVMHGLESRSLNKDLFQASP